MKNKCRTNNWFSCWRTLCYSTLMAVVVAFTLTPQAFAGIANNGLFELDANPQDPTPAVAPDDWETLYNNGDNNGGSPIKFSHILSDPAPNSIFNGGKKDIQDINQWSWGNGSVPDKDNLTNAYAAAYSDNGDLLLYFGADRFANVGDAFMGFWFFKQKVVAELDGSFSGLHTAGDTLVLVDYPQGANEVPYIAVVIWDTSCTKAASNNPSPGQCAAANLRLKSESSGTTGAICGSLGADKACAITNLTDVDSPWPYTPKTGIANVFPYESFFEGGINLTQLIGGDTCFSSFMAETRSSSSFTASLKDFVLGSFETCGVKIVKSCTTANLAADNQSIEYTFSGAVTNTGFGTLHDIKVMDNNGTSDPGDDFEIHLVGNVTDLAAGDTVAFGSPLTFTSTLNKAKNSVTVTAASTPGGEPTISDKSLDNECPKLELSPVISVTKDCKPTILTESGKLVVKVGVSGMVCNTTTKDGNTVNGPINLTDVKVWDDINNTLDPGDDVLIFQTPLLQPGECKNYASYDSTTLYSGYYPAGASSTVPAEISFSDTVHAQGVAPLNFGIATNSASATCRLCPTCPDCPTTPTP